MKKQKFLLGSYDLMFLYLIILVAGHVFVGDSVSDARSVFVILAICFIFIVFAVIEIVEKRTKGEPLTEENIVPGTSILFIQQVNESIVGQQLYLVKLQDATVTLLHIPVKPVQTEGIQSFMSNTSYYLSSDGKWCRVP